MFYRTLVFCAGLVLFAEPSCAEVRIGIPSFAVRDPFVKELVESAILSKNGIKLRQNVLENSSVVLDQVLDGTVDVGLFMLDILQQSKKLKHPPQLAQLLLLPFQFESAQQLFEVEDSALGDAILADINRTGLFPLAYWNRGLSQIATKTSIETSDDLRGLKVAARGDSAIPIFVALGAKPKTDISSKEVANALSRGVIDASEVDPMSVDIPFLRESRSRSLIIGVRPMVGVLVASAAFWEKASEAKKQLLREVAASAARASRQLTIRDEGEAPEETRSAKVSYVQFGGDEIERLRSISRETYILNRARWATQSVAEKEFIGLQEALKATKQGSKKKTQRDSQLKTQKDSQLTPQRQQPRQRPQQPARSPVVFLTDRNDEHHKDIRQRFGSKRLFPPPLTCGEAWFDREPGRAAGNDVTAVPDVTPDPLPSGDAACLVFIRSAIAQRGAKGVILYIHGFHNSLVAALQRAVQIANDLGFDGLMLVWSWPSEGNSQAYFRDEEATRWAQPHVNDFFSALLEQTTEAKIDLVSHSMGARLLLPLMIRLRARGQTNNTRSVVFAAPDEDQAIFQRDLAASQVMASKLPFDFVTLYASSNDWAIKVSTWLHGGARAGSGGENIFCTDDLETIDASLLIGDDVGHGYIFGHIKALADLKALLQGLRAEQRGLIKRTKGTTCPYWLLIE